MSGQNDGAANGRHDEVAMTPAGGEAVATAAHGAGNGASAANGGSRLAVRKTYKLWIGGASVRSESGRVLPIAGPAGHLANAAQGSRKDARDAVRAGRGALAGWSGRTAYNRGQILYRMAEVLEARTEELAASVAAGRGLPLADARAEVAAAVDTCVYHAGWTDKLDAVLGTVNPVAQPYFSFSRPTPIGVVVLLAPPEPCLLGLVSHLAPTLAGANVVVACVSEPHPLASLDLAEVLATSDVPAGVVNLLSGRHAELAPVLAAHADVDCIVDAAGDGVRTAGLRRAAAASVTRYRAPVASRGAYLTGEATRNLAAVERTVETTTTWHPVGA